VLQRVGLLEIPGRQVLERLGLLGIPGRQVPWALRLVLVIREARGPVVLQVGSLLLGLMVV